MVEECGPVTVYAQESRIVFMVRVRFASVIVRARSIRIGFWLPCRIKDSSFREEIHGPGAFGYYRTIG